MAWLKTNLKQYKNEQKRIDEYMDYRVKKGMEEHKTSAVLDHPDGSVTDEKIGNRTIVNPITPSEEVTGTLTRLLSVMSNAVQTLRTNLSQTHSTLDAKIAQGDETTLTNANEYTRSYSYSKSAVDTALSAKAEKATTLSGYGIGDAYTKGEVNGAITSPKDNFEFSNGIQLKAEGEDVLLIKDGVEQGTFIKTLVDKTYVFAELADRANLASKADLAAYAETASMDENKNIIHEHYATKEEVNSTKTVFEFSNGIGLVAVDDEAYGELIYLQKKDSETGDIYQQLFIQPDGDGKLKVIATHDGDGQYIHDHYATNDKVDYIETVLGETKEEVGNIETVLGETKEEVGSIEAALDNIIVIQNTLIGGETV